MENLSEELKTFLEQIGPLPLLTDMIYFTSHSHLCGNRHMFY